MSEPDDRTARSTRDLLESFWSAFHHAWGVNAEGGYSKVAWMDLQDTTMELFAKAGLERRRLPRLPGTTWSRPRPKR